MSLRLEIEVNDKGSAKIKKMTGDVKKLDKQTNKSSKSMMSGFKNAKLAIVGMTAAIGGTIYAISRVIGKVTSFEDKIAKSSKAMGVSTEFLSGMSFAAERSGASFESVERGIKLMMRQVKDANDGLMTSKRNFDQLGISLKAQNGQLKDGKTLFLEIANKLAGMEDATKKAALAQQIFGRSGIDLVPLLNEGAAGIERLTDQAKSFGVVIDKEAATKAEKFRDNLTNLNNAFKGIEYKIVNAAIPAITNFISALTPTRTQLSQVTEATIKNITNFDILTTTYNRLAQKVNKTETETKLYKDTIDTLQRDYSKYLKNINLEKDGYRNINTALQNARKSLVEYSQTQAALAIQKDLLQEAASLSRKIIELNTERSELEVKIKAEAEGSAIIFQEGLATVTTQNALSLKYQTMLVDINQLEADRLKIIEKITQVVQDNNLLTIENKKINKENEPIVEKWASNVQQSEMAIRGIAIKMPKVNLEGVKFTKVTTSMKNDLQNSLTSISNIYNAMQSIMNLGDPRKWHFKDFLSFAMGGVGLFSGIKGLFGFQHGGDFTVGGSGGVDSQLVAFRASPGERVNITPANQTTNNNANNYFNINISTQNIDDFFVRTQLIPMLNKSVRDRNVPMYASRIV